MPSIKLQSSDGEIFEVDADIAKQCVAIFADLDMDKDEVEPILLPIVNAVILQKVIQWCTYYKNDPPLLKADETKEKRTDDVCPWDSDFFNVDKDTLFKIILAANYLDIKGLLDVACKVLAKMMHGKSTEELRKSFNIKMTTRPKRKSRFIPGHVLIVTGRKPRVFREYASSPPRYGQLCQLTLNKKYPVENLNRPLLDRAVEASASREHALIHPGTERK